MNAEVIPLVERLVSALVTGMYQGLLLTGIVWLCLKLARDTNAATRYATWWAALVAVAALPVAHFLLLPATPRLPEDAVAPAAPASMAQLEPAPGSIGNNYDAQPWTEVEPTQDEGNAGADNHGDVPHEVMAPPAPNDAFVDLAPPESNEAPVTAQMAGNFIGKLQRLSQSFGAVSLPVSRTAGITILCAVLALSAGRLLALMLQLLALREMRQAANAPPGWLQEQFENVASQAGLRRRADLLISEIAHSPMVVGLHPPAILIPEQLLATPEPARLTPVLRHEIAHLQRFDDWFNLGQQALKALFGFHPVVHWISRRISLEREIACDDHVLHAGQKPREYARVLTEFATQSRGRAWSAAPAAWNRKSQLTERVNMILKSNRSVSPQVGRTRLGVVSVTLVGSAVLLLAAAPRLSLGEEPPAPGLAPAPPAPVHPVVVAHGSAASLAAGTVIAGPGPMQPAVVHAVGVERRIAQSGERWKDDSVNAAPRPGQRPRPDVSIEERLERLERMVERLVNQPRSGGGFGGPMQPGVAPEARSAPAAPQAPRSPMAPAAPLVTPGMPPQGPGAFMHGRGQGEFNERLNSIVWRAEGEGDLHLRALEARRRALEQQIATLESQLHQLERQQDQLEREREKMEEQRERQMRERDRARQERQEALKRREQLQEETKSEQKQDEKKMSEREQGESSRNARDAEEGGAEK